MLIYSLIQCFLIIYPFHLFHLSNRRNYFLRAQMWVEPWRGCQRVDQGAQSIPPNPQQHENLLFRDRKLSTSSTGNMKSKWVNAFKNIKGKQEAGRAPCPIQTLLLNRKSGGVGAAPVGPPPILENSHVFQEYTYKKITPCDVCSQILRGHTRQGLKCKLCRQGSFYA